MRYLESDLPEAPNFGIRKAEAVNRQPNQFTTKDFSQSVHLPVLSIAFSDGTVDLEQQVQQTRLTLDRVRRFLLECSNGFFGFDHFLRSCTLTQPRNWRGNLPDAKPLYDPGSGELANPEDFIPASEYTGFDPFVVYGLNPAQFGHGPANIFRDYRAQALDNVLTAAIAELNAADTSAARPHWDDEISARDLALWAFPEEGGGALVVNSGQFARTSVHRLSQSTRLGAGRGIAAALSTPQKGEGDSWQAMAKGLLQMLFGFASFHNGAETSDDVSETQWEIGFLGGGDQSVSILADPRSGPHLDAVHKFFLGWLDPQFVEPTFHSKVFTLDPVYQNWRNALVLRPNKHLKPEEFFVVETRNTQGTRADGTPIEFDKALEDGTVNDGVMEYHVKMTDQRPGPFVSAMPFLRLQGFQPQFTSVHSAIMMLADGSPNRTTSYFHNYLASGLHLASTPRPGSKSIDLRVTWTLDPKTEATHTNDGHLHVVTRLAGGAVAFKSFDGTKWTPSQTGWEELSASTSHRPAISSAANELSIFARAPDGEAFFRERLENKPWSASSWQRAGDDVHGTIRAGKPGIFTYALTWGGESEILVKQRNSTGWSPSNIDFAIQGWPQTKHTPIGVGTPDNMFYVFVRRLYREDLQYGIIQEDSLVGGPSEWHTMQGTIDADPFPLAFNDEILLFVRGTSGRLFVDTFKSNGTRLAPTGWVNLDGQILGPPSAVKAGNEAIVFVTGTSGRVFAKKGYGTKWTGWANLGNAVIDSPFAVANDGKIDVLCTTTKGEANHLRFDETTWPPPANQWTNIGGPID